MRRIATPGEVARWYAQLEALPEHRRVAVIGMLSEVVDDCRWCDDPVRRCESRTAHDGRIVHLGCSHRFRLTQPRRTGRRE